MAKITRFRAFLDTNESIYCIKVPMDQQIIKATDLLRNGDVVGIPTETVYGLGASIQSRTGIEKIFSIKERPFFDPLIVHISSIEQAKKYVKAWTPLCDLLAKKFWPGPLTMVLKKTELVDDLITAGLDSVGLRMPNHPLTLELIQNLGNPIAAPSANKFKKTSPTSYQHVKESFSETFVLDGGPCEVGIESTVIGVFENKISLYRPGMITKSTIEDLLTENNLQVTVEEVESPVAPGQMKHHYMPKVPVVLFKGKEINTKMLPSEVNDNPVIMKLNPSAVLAARDLYQDLRKFDKNVSCIVISLSQEQLKSDDWCGIVNRLDKASSFIV